MAKEDETPRANPAEIENLIGQIRRTNLEPGAEEKIERLLRTRRSLRGEEFERTETAFFWLKTWTTQGPYAQSPSRTTR